MRTVTAILLGAGQRGVDAYASYALKFPGEIKFIAVAEPRENRRKEFAALHSIAPELCFDSWEQLVAMPRLADCALVCTQDRMHTEPVVRLLRQGYHVLCEKPMAVEKQEILEMEAVAKQTGKSLTICHVLRYSPFFVEIKRLLDDGVIGDLITIQHMESIGYWHMAHSFVRGNWRDSHEASPIIMAKCCHDLDILLYLCGSHCKRVSSFGSLSHFTASHAPEGAPMRCTDGCPQRDVCPYYAPRFYLEHPKAVSDNFVHVLTMDGSPDGIIEALRTSQYGRCVYHCDNDVCDHQVVNLEYENGITASMTMSAFTAECQRTITLMGSHGQIVGNMEQNCIVVEDFTSGKKTSIHIQAPHTGHGGSDIAMMKDFIRLVQNDGAAGSRSDVSLSVEAHLIALAAEESRVRNGLPIDPRT